MKTVNFHAYEKKTGTLLSKIYLNEGFFERKIKAAVEFTKATLAISAKRCERRTGE